MLKDEKLTVTSQLCLIYVLESHVVIVKISITSKADYILSGRGRWEVWGDDDTKIV